MEVETKALTAVVFILRLVKGKMIKGNFIAKDHLQEYMKAVTIYITLPENCSWKILLQPVPKQPDWDWKPHPILENMYNYSKKFHSKPKCKELVMQRMIKWL